jgi:hypothetical protein
LRRVLGFFNLQNRRLLSPALSPKKVEAAKFWLSH